MSDAPARAASDWTDGPAKWAAVIVLGAASITGMSWSMWRTTSRTPAILPVMPAMAREQPVTPASTAAPEPAPPPPTPTPLKRININTASAAELELLPGVGPAVARRIIEHRQTIGAFKSVEDLDNVKGIGPRTMEKLREFVTVE